jgi:tripartite-type tricarboxylate transporter receptor subunit TctC
VKIVGAGFPGSSMELSARAIAEPMSKSWGQPIIIEMRPGANGVIGADAVAKAAPDGYTLLFVLTTFVQSPYMTRDMPYDPIKSFAPIGQTQVAPLWFAINSDIPAKTVKEFVAIVKAAPGKYAYSSPGTGSSPHLYAHILSQRTGLDMLHVPYKGLPPAVLDASTGRVAGVFATIVDMSRFVDAGKLRILASTGSSRSKLTPDVPTFQEAGVPGLDLAGWGGMLAPAGMPPALIQRINASMNEAIMTPEVSRRLTSFGFEPTTSTPEQFGALVRRELETWKQIAISAGVKPE